jgi:hypothetical protein
MQHKLTDKDFIMPCRDYYDYHPEEYFKSVTEPALKKQVAFAESALCAALAALEHVDSLVETVSPKQGDYYNWLNFAEAGISKEELVKWHKRHKILDEKHRSEEREKKRVETLKKSALSKLTEEEKRVLGVK